MPAYINGKVATRSKATPSGATAGAWCGPRHAFERLHILDSGECFDESAGVRVGGKPEYLICRPGLY